MGVLVVIAAAALLALVAPLFFIASKLYRRGRLLVLPVCILQLLPAAVLIAAWQYSLTHMRVPFFSYERPSFAQLFLVLGLVQFFVSASVSLFLQETSFRVLAFAALSVAGAAGVTFIGMGVVSCATGNCF